MSAQTVTQAYRFALAPTPRQAGMLASHAGGARFAYNWGLAAIFASLDARQAEKDAGTEPTTPVPSHFDLCKQWTAWKNTAGWTDKATGEVTEGVPWVAQNFVGTYQAALRDADTARKNFFSSLAGRRAGRRVGRPRFKAKGRSRDSFQVHGQTLGVADAKHVKLPKIGVVKTHENTRKLGRRLRAGTARIIRGTVAKDSAGRWHIALTVEVQRDVRTSLSARQRAGGTVGVDMGVRDTVTLSTGQVFANPAHLEASLRRLAVAQRTVARRTRRGQPSSKRRLKAVARAGRIHNRVAAQRLDYLQNLSTRLVHTHELIGVEGFDLQQIAAGASKDLPAKVRRARNRHLAGSALGMFRWQLQSKAAWYGCQVKVTTAHALTGRTCSRCGQPRATAVPPYLELFTCPSCGLVEDRRRNTAVVLAGWARQEIGKDAGTGPESQNARREDRSPDAGRKAGSRRSPPKREASTRPRRGQAGTPGT